MLTSGSNYMRYVPCAEEAYTPPPPCGLLATSFVSQVITYYVQTVFCAVNKAPIPTRCPIRFKSARWFLGFPLCYNCSRACWSWHRTSVIK